MQNVFEFSEFLDEFWRHPQTLGHLLVALQSRNSGSSLWAKLHTRNSGKTRSLETERHLRDSITERCCLSLTVTHCKSIFYTCCKCSDNVPMLQRQPTAKNFPFLNCCLDHFKKKKSLNIFKCFFKKRLYVCPPAC